MSFLSDFFNVGMDNKEYPVLCPFPHYNGVTSYFEERPSASVNPDKGVFHCMSCDKGYSELQFIQEILGCKITTASWLQQDFNQRADQTAFEWSTQELSLESEQLAMSLGLSKETIEALQIKTNPGITEPNLAYPVILYGHLLDIRTYVPNAKPKCRSMAGAQAGYIVPFDNWALSDKYTVICAGEKDMSIARQKGFNAITFTGGEMATPRTPALFKNKNIAILYDNDETGRQGAIKVANALAPYAKTIKVVTNFWEVCTEKGEDIHDFFIKYGKSAKDLHKYIQDTPAYTPTPEAINLPKVNLYQASLPKNINKVVQANIQVAAVYDSTFIAPIAASLTKRRLSGFDDTMQAGEVKFWEFEDHKAVQLLHLMDNNFKETDILNNLRDLSGVMRKERCITTSILSKATIYKAVVTDMFETNLADSQPMEFTAYSINHKLESGKKYLATLSIVAHPYSGQRLVMIITNVQQANDSVSDFAITKETKAHLKEFQKLQGSVKDRIELLAEKLKGILGYDGNNQLITTLDLAYHTPLLFNFGKFKDVRGYLDTLIVGESRVGKSSTADTLRKLYQLGTFVSLAGSSATIAGIVGGSNKGNNGAFQTRAGVLPQNHKSLIIFEELGKSDVAISKALTDIRSSNEVRIARVSGSITLPALVRLVSLTNPKQTNGMIRSIASYPNGIAIVTDLVTSAEDIARYDIILILADKGSTSIDPDWEPEKPFTEAQYRTKIRWIWSRKAEQIIISKDVLTYIIEKANELNADYDSHIKIFGTEAWKKISRLAIAVAGYLVSTDETYENIVVEKAHVDFAVDYFRSIYDNATFKLREYVQLERSYNELDQDGIEALQALYIKAPSVIQILEQHSALSRGALTASAGLPSEELSRVLNSLITGKFVRQNSTDLIPTERFRKGVCKISRKTRVPKVGDKC